MVPCAPLSGPHVTPSNRGGGQGAKEEMSWEDGGGWPSAGGARGPGLKKKLMGRSSLAQA